MRTIFAAITLAALGVASPVGAAPDDFTVLSTVSSPRGGTRPLIQYVSSTRIRISDGDRDATVTLPSGKVVLYSGRRREYWETSLDEIAAFGSQLDAALARGDTMEPMRASVAVLKGPDHRKIAGYDADHYTLTLGDVMSVEVWLAPALPVPPSYYDARKVLYATFGPMGRRFDRMFDEMKTLKGFPLAMSVDYRMRMSNRKVVTEATEVKKDPIPDAIFEVPAGYTKTPSPFARRE